MIYDIYIYMYIYIVTYDSYILSSIGLQQIEMMMAVSGPAFFSRDEVDFLRGAKFEADDRRSTHDWEWFLQAKNGDDWGMVYDLST